MSARRWECPSCHDGVLAPDRPRRDDVRRYCLPCSKKRGRLVERICPAKLTAAQRAAESKRAAAERRALARKAQQETRREERAVAKAAERSAREALRAMPWEQLRKLTDSHALAEAARRYAKLKAWEQDLSDVTFQIRRSTYKSYTSGHAYPGRAGHRRYMVTVGSDIADAHTAILHELAHIAAGPKESHGARWRGFYLMAVTEVVGHRIEVPSDADIRGLDKAVQRALALHLYGGAEGAQP